MIEMELKTKCSYSTMRENWEECKESLKRNVYKMVPRREPDSTDDVPGTFSAHLQ